MGRTSSRFANNTAACVFLYMAIGKLFDHVFLEEWEELNVPEPMRVVLYGSVTGAVYKSTRGRAPMMLGAALGGVVGSAYAYAWMRFR